MFRMSLPRPRAPALPSDPAARLLLVCARADLGLADGGELSEAGQAVTDWEQVRALAGRHGLAPLLHHWLARDEQAAVPPAFRAWLVDRCRGNAFRALAFTRELLRLIGRFEAGGLEVIAFKGPVLAQQLYGQVARREFSDLDLLVRSRDAPAAAGLLREEGYRPHYELTAAQFARLRTFEGELPHADPDRGFAVDLHWRLAPAPYRDAFPEEELWCDLQEVSLGGRAVRTLAPAVLAPYLLLHHAKHNWAWLGWLNEIALLLRGFDAAAWERLEAAAARHRLGRMLRLGCHLVQSLHGLPLPEAIAAAVRADPRLPELARAVEAELWEPADRPPRFQLFRAAMDHPADVRRYWCANVFTPRPEDWRLIDLPGPLHFLYRPLRLLRLVAKRLHFRRAPAGT